MRWGITDKDVSIAANILSTQHSFYSKTTFMLLQDSFILAERVKAAEAFFWHIGIPPL